MTALPNDYDADPSRFLASEEYPHDDVHPYVARRLAAAGVRTVLDEDPAAPIREARRVLRPGGIFAACAPNRDSHPELAGVRTGWGEASTFDGEDAPAIVASVFGVPGGGRRRVA